MRSTLITISSAFLLASVVSASALKRRDSGSLPQYWSQLSACAVDSPRVIKNVDVFDRIDNSPATCVAYCDANGYLYAGVEYGQECHCGRDVNSFTTVDASECDMSCTGDDTTTCGGRARIQLFRRDITGYATELTSGWEVSKTCAIDSTSKRALCNAHVYSQDAHNTPASCTALCQSKGYAFAGTEYGKECICGTGIRHDVEDAPSSDCSFACPGGDDARMTCGAGDRLQIYKLSSVEQSICPSDCPSTAVTGSLPSSSGKFDIINVKTAWRFDVAYYGTAPGTTIIAQTHNVPDTDNQAWTFSQVDALGQSGTYFVRSAMSPNQFVSFRTNGAVTDTTAIPFNITDVGNGHYTIGVPYSGKVFASQSTATLQVKLQLVDYSDTQLWQIVARS